MQPYLYLDGQYIVGYDIYIRPDGADLKTKNYVLHFAKAKQNIV